MTVISVLHNFSTRTSWLTLGKSYLVLVGIGWLCNHFTCPKGISRFGLSSFWKIRLARPSSALIGTRVYRSRIKCDFVWATPPLKYTFYFVYLTFLSLIYKSVLSTWLLCFFCLVPTMSRLLYGSSNVYRNYSRSPFPKSGFTLVECTRKVVFDAHIASLGKLDVNSLIVTSVLENLVTDACRDLAADQAEFFARQQVTVHVDALFLYFTPPGS